MRSLKGLLYWMLLRYSIRYETDCFKMLSLQGAVRKKMSKEQVQLYFDASNLVKTMLVEQFNLTKTLYFSFTHLVCRTALPSKCVHKHDLVSEEESLDAVAM